MRIKALIVALELSSRELYAKTVIALTAAVLDIPLSEPDPPARLIVEMS